MRTKKLSNQEKQINQRIESGEITPVRIPRLKTSTEIIKYQLCSEIIKYKNENDLLQKDIAAAIRVNKSEISKIFSYQLEEFSTERLFDMVEVLIKRGAGIRLENIFEEVKKKASDLDKRMRPSA
jgi:predicted XRE-type DNA-binding protein